MLSKTKEYYGKPLTYQKITPGNTITGIGANIYNYKEFQVSYDSCDLTGGILPGHVLYGNSSGAYGIVITASVTSGAVGTGNAAGVIRFHSYTGTFADNEKIKLDADTDIGDIDGTATQCASPYAFEKMDAKCVLLQAETQSQRVSMLANPMLPDQTSDYGFLLADKESIVLTDIDVIKNVRTVDATGGSAGSLNVWAFF
jgi:hypothetical protein